MSKMSKRKKDEENQSEYWKEFESVEADPQAKQCKTCRKIVRISNNSTSNLIKHLNIRHNGEMTPDDGSSILDPNEAILFMIVKECLALSFVDSQGSEKIIFFIALL